MSKVLSQLTLSPPSLQRLFHSDTVDYASRIRSQGASIRQNDLLVIDRFVKGIYAAGLRSSLLDVSPLAGNNLTAALTKLWYPTGVQSNLTNNNFVEADYSRTTGLTGNATNKYLNTGLVPSSFFTSSVSIGVYNRTNTTEASTEISSYNSSTAQALNLYAQYSLMGTPYTIFDSFNVGVGLVSGQGRAVVSLTDARGLIIGSRISSSDSKIYQNGNIRHSISSSGGSPPNIPVWYFALNNNGSPAAFSGKSIGFFYIGQGLTSTQVSVLTAIVSQLMTGLGRSV